MGLLELFCPLMGIWLVVADPVEKDLRFDGKAYKDAHCIVEQFVKPTVGQWAQFGAHAIIVCTNKDTGQLLEPKLQPPKVYLRDVRAVYQADPRCKGPVPPAPVAKRLIYDHPTAAMGMPADEAARLQAEYEDDLYEDDLYEDAYYAEAGR